MNTKTCRPHTKLLKTSVAMLLGAAVTMTAMAQPPPQVGNSSDSAHAFLSFSEGLTAAQTPASAKAYMALIDPGQKKVTFPQWLTNAGFISDPSQWTPNGQQTYTNVPGVYGPGVINAFAHIIILNSADLGFIRNQYIRCNPNCLAPNARIYTYLENYGPKQFARLNADGSGDESSSTTNTREAVTIALERRSTDPRAGGRIADVEFEWAPASNGTNPSHNFAQTYAYVVQAHEPLGFSATNPADCLIAPLASGTTPNYTPLLPPRDTVVDEGYFWPSDGGNDQAVWDCKFNLRTPTAAPTDVDRIGYLTPRPDNKVLSGDVFAPELDLLGTKMMPGVCLVCHGGNLPSNVGTSANPWGTTGEIKEFKYLPGDATNSVFGCDDRASASGADACNTRNFNHAGFVVTSPLVHDGTAPTYAANMTRSAQEIELKKYNQAVLITQGANPPKVSAGGKFDANGVITGANWTFPMFTDGTIKRPNAGVELILGWYAVDRNNTSNTVDATMGGAAFPNPDCVIDPKTSQPKTDCGEPILQNDGFVPIAWRGASTAGAQPAGQPPVTPADLYLNVVAHDCRSCHANRETSLDFGSERQFSANKGNVQDYVFQPECDAKLGQISPQNIVMPLARLTWERLWNGVDPISNIANDGASSTAVADLTSPINKLKAYFGQTPTSYCAHPH